MYVNSCNKTKVGFVFLENNLIYRNGVSEELGGTSLPCITRLIAFVALTRTRTAITLNYLLVVITHCLMEKVTRLMRKVLKVSCPRPFPFSNLNQ